MFIVFNVIKEIRFTWAECKCVCVCMCKYTAFVNGWWFATATMTMPMKYFTLLIITLVPNFFSFLFFSFHFPCHFSSHTHTHAQHTHSTASFNSHFIRLRPNMIKHIPIHSARSIVTLERVQFWRFGGFYLLCFFAFAFHRFLNNIFRALSKRWEIPLSDEREREGERKNNESDDKGSDSD